MALIISPDNYAPALTRALVAAGIPVIGVAVPDPNNRATWRIDYHPTATAQHRTDGEALKASISMTDPSVVAREQALMAQGEVVNNKAIQALATAIHKRIRAAVPADTVTPQQWAAAIRTEYDALP